MHCKFDDFYEDFELDDSLDYRIEELCLYGSTSKVYKDRLNDTKLKELIKAFKGTCLKSVVIGCRSINGLRLQRWCKKNSLNYAVSEIK